MNLDVFCPQPELTGPTVVLRQLDETYLDDVWEALHDNEVRRFTGTHTAFSRQAMADWLARRPEQEDRADWAVVRDGEYLGEVVLNDVDPGNESASFRIALAGPHVFGRGYGTEATRLVLDFAFETAKLHRVSLEVFEFNTRARRAYEKCGFVAEGVLRDALLWDGDRHDVIAMSVLAPDWRLR